MLPEIKEVVWRGPWILVKLRDENSRQLFNECWLRIYFGEMCLAEGLAKTLIDEHPSEQSNDPNVLLDICFLENKPGVWYQPTLIEISFENESSVYQVLGPTREKTYKNERRLPVNAK